MDRLSVMMVALLLGAGAFWDGLYAPEEQLVLTAGFAMLLLWQVVATRRHDRATVPESGALLLGADEAFAVAMLAVGVALSLLHPAAAGTAAHGPVVVTGWLLALAVGRRLRNAEGALALTWSLAGMLMVFGGLAAMSYLPADHSGRLPSFFGYPIAVGVLGMLGLAGSLPWLQAGRWWAPVLAFGNAAGIILSGSRGVWAVCLLLLLYLGWAAPHLLRRLPWPVAVALGASLFTGPAVAGRHPWQALLPFLLGSLTMLAVNRAWWRRLRWAAGAAWGVAALLAPGWGWFLGRATALSFSEGSTVERFTFMRDALALAAHLPLGAGYRAWAALQLQHASYAYYSVEVHSAPLDLALAFGWAGGIAFLLLLLRFWWGLRHGREWPAERLVLLAALGALGLHGLVDWDLSFGVFAMALWLGIGLMAPEGRTIRLPSWLAPALASLGLASALLLGTGDMAEWLAEQALTTGHEQMAARHAAMAVAVFPTNDLAYAVLGEAQWQLGEHEAALAAYQRARQLGPNEPWYAHLQATALMADGEPEAAAAAWREYVRLWPWQSAAYESALNAHIQMLLAAEVEHDASLTKVIVDSGRTILAAMDRQKGKEPAHTPRKPMPVDSPTIREARTLFNPPG